MKRGGQGEGRGERGEAKGEEGEAKGEEGEAKGEGRGEGPRIPRLSWVVFVRTQCSRLTPLPRLSLLAMSPTFYCDTMPESKRAHPPQKFVRGS